MKNTVTTFQQMKEKGEKISMLTAYDYSTAKLVDEAGVNSILVGDSLGNVMLGYEDTIAVTVEDMIHHGRAVAKGAKNALVVVDMPFMSYQTSVYDAVVNAGRIMKETHCGAVKLEGGAVVCPQIKAIVDASIPVCAHLGLTPQSINAFGGFKVQGKTVEAAQKLIDDAKAVEAAGAFAVVLECVPAKLAKLVSEAVSIPTIGIGALAALQILALLIGIDVFGNGFSSLLHGRPARGTLVSFAALASLLHCASLLVFPDQGGVAVPYTAVSILLLYAEMREARGRSLAQARSYRAVCEAEQPLAVYSHYDSEIDACNAVKCPLYDASSFLTEIERPDTVDRFSLIYTPIALALAIILSLVASFNCGEPVRFFWAFSAILSVSAPVGLLCAFGASYKNTASRLLRSGAAIAGARQANLLRGTEKVMLLENDLFPTGSIELEAIDNLGRITDEQILGCAAALTESAGLELGRVLTDTTKERFGITFTARDVRLVEGGVTGAVGTSRIVLGTAALMVKMGIPIESGHKGQINMYLVVDNALAGVLTMRYQTTKNTYKAMRLMRRMHMNVVLAVRDFNISPAMIEEEFDLRRGFADQPDPAGVDRLLNPNYAKGDAPAAILTREGAGPFMQVLRGADKLAGAVRSALTLGTFAGLLGMLIVFYLLYQNAADALPVMNILLYQLIWYIPVFIITQQTR